MMMMMMMIEMILLQGQDKLHGRLTRGVHHRPGRRRRRRRVGFPNVNGTGHTEQPPIQLFMNAMYHWYNVGVNNDVGGMPQLLVGVNVLGYDDMQHLILERCGYSMGVETFHESHNVVVVVVVAVTG